MNKKIRNTLIVTALLLMITIIWSMYLKKIEVEAKQVVVGDVVSTALENGNLESEQENKIYSEAQGKIKKVYVQEGTRVRKGEVLAEIDTSDIDAQIKQLKGELKAAEGSSISLPTGNANSIKQQQYAVELAQTTLKYTQNEFDRMKKLYQEGATTFAELEKAKTEMIKSQKALAQAKSELEVVKNQNSGSGLQLEGQKNSIDAQIERLMLQKAKAVIRAGYDGTVLEKEVETGDYINIGDLTFVIGNTDKMNIVSYVNSNNINDISSGNQVKIIIKLPGKDREVTGSVVKLSPATVQRKSALGLDENDVKITVSIPKDLNGIRLIPGMDVDTVFTVQKAKSVLAVPKDSVFTDAGSHMVWVIKNGKTVLKKVEIGIEGDSLTEIKSGLSKGDLIITNPHMENLKEGIFVKIKG